MENYCKISEKVDSVKFFKGLNSYFRDATTLFIEGDSISKEVMNLYKKHIQEGEYLPRTGTIFPKSTKIRCKYSAEFMNELALMAESHAEPELCDHLHLYKNNDPVIEWMDAFSDEILISKTIPEEMIHQFSDAITLSTSGNM